MMTPVPCVLVARPTEPPRVGDLWAFPELRDDPPSLILTPYYWAHNAHRAPFYVRLPTCDWCLDSRALHDGVLQPDGWIVTGDAPLFTVSPSIAIGTPDEIGYWHGFLEQGVIHE